jgi:hypothetical protein
LRGGVVFEFGVEPDKQHQIDALGTGLPLPEVMRH